MNLLYWKKKNCFNFCVRHKLKFLVWKRTGCLIMFISQAGSGTNNSRINDKNVCLCFQLTVPQFSGRCSYHEKYYPLQLWTNFNLSIHPQYLSKAKPKYWTCAVKLPQFLWVKRQKLKACNISRVCIPSWRKLSSVKVTITLDHSSL